MGAARKLQQEIDLVMKKVKEGIASFDEIHEKARTLCFGSRLPRFCVHGLLDPRASLVEQP
jgi:organic hydroperoxide reductase OsmC/OhrA